MAFHKYHAWMNGIRSICKSGGNVQTVSVSNEKSWIFIELIFIHVKYTDTHTHTAIPHTVYIPKLFVFSGDTIHNSKC